MSAEGFFIPSIGLYIMTVAVWAVTPCSFRRWLPTIVPKVGQYILLKRWQQSENVHGVMNRKNMSLKLFLAFNYNLHVVINRLNVR
jgi:hypothetical protein